MLCPELDATDIPPTSREAKIRKHAFLGRLGLLTQLDDTQVLRWLLPSLHQLAGNAK